MSISFILIKSFEQHHPTIVYQILSSADQLAKQLPINSLSSTNRLLSISAEPLIEYISQLTTNSNYSKQATEILLNFTMVKGSFKDSLVLLNNLILNTTDVFNVEDLIRRMNRYLSQNITDGNFQSFAFDYLKSQRVYPTNELPAHCFTGQFISSIILSCFDIENQLHPNQLFSMPSEFHSNTIETLFHMIEKLISTSSSYNLTIHQNIIIIICLRLFNYHLELLSLIQFESFKAELLQTWYDFLYHLLSSNYSEEIHREISKILVNIIINQSTSFDKKVSTFYGYLIQENRYPLLTEQILIRINQTEFLDHWIDCLCDKNQTMDTLNSIVDCYFQGNQIIESMILSFQSILLYRLIEQQLDQKLSTLVAHYLSYLFQKRFQIESILIVLCLMTDSNAFLYEAIQPIFLVMLPLLVDYHLSNPNFPSADFRVYLIGKISQMLIIGLPYESVELKYANKFELLVCNGGCVLNQNDELLQTNLAKSCHMKLTDEYDDNGHFRFSIYWQKDSGAELLSKLKQLTKIKQRFLPKSIQQQANDASAYLFAVYLKFYRRVNFAKAELTRNDEIKPANQLVSLYEHAIRVQDLFIKIKGQGGDCDELLKQIQNRTLFLLTYIKESDLIPIEDETIQIRNIPKTPLERAVQYQRQKSNWTRARHILKILRNSFQACIKFKKFMLERKEKKDAESSLKQAIEHFVYDDLDQMNNDEKEELENCLNRQYQRSLVRLMAYQFLKIFIEKLENKEKYLKIFLFYLKKSDVNWTYLEYIRIANKQIQNQISDTYYSIIKLAIPFISQSTCFSLLNLSYDSMDIRHISQYEIFKSIFQYANTNEYSSMLFQCLQIYTLKLCANIHFEKEQNFIFTNIIFNEIKQMNLKENLPKTLRHLSRTNLKYLVFLLRLIIFHENIAISHCSTIDYLEELFRIRSESSSDVVQILIIKLLQYIIPNIRKENAKNQIDKFLIETFNQI